jgi:hypothetical protein
MQTLLRLSALALALLASGVAQAQPDRSASPQTLLTVSGDATAQAAVQAGGSDRVAVQGSGCSGFISNGSPVAAVAWSGSGALSIYATSGADTTLLIADPSGRWHCSDDANGSNPGVTIASAASGRYLVWVGTFEPGTARATLSAKAGPPAW